ncbi:hypothetical protein L195_g021538 [Trifolium pratense]|uniref:Uncharacterized protein n=1 Tax=Trifolium pratense TaxID=57577 RepID=A0A2K3N5K0_TRIPR|nr:hypothetical protein L195_g021538 [Trifolium pratense]
MNLNNQCPTPSSKVSKSKEQAGVQSLDRRVEINYTS